MPSTLARKSFTDLPRLKARALFTVLALALAVASVSILAVSPLMERSMEREVAANRLPDGTVSMAPLNLGGATSVRLAALPNVMTDRSNGRANGFRERAGAVARVIASDGAARSLRISGVARNLTGADRVKGEFVTLYASTETVAALNGLPGYSSLGFRLRDNNPAATEQLIAHVRNELRANA